MVTVPRASDDESVLFRALRLHLLRCGCRCHLLRPSLLRSRALLLTPLRTLLRRLQAPVHSHRTGKQHTVEGVVVRRTLEPGRTSDGPAWRPPAALGLPLPAGCRARVEYGFLFRRAGWLGSS